VQRFARAVVADDDRQDVFFAELQAAAVELGNEGREPGQPPFLLAAAGDDRVASRHLGEELHRRQGVVVGPVVQQLVLDAEDLVRLDDAHGERRMSENPRGCCAGSATIREEYGTALLPATLGRRETNSSGPHKFQWILVQAVGEKPIGSMQNALPYRAGR
jgi:hypothetical protein